MRPLVNTINKRSKVNFTSVPRSSMGSQVCVGNNTATCGVECCCRWIDLFVTPPPGPAVPFAVSFGTLFRVWDVKS